MQDIATIRALLESRGLRPKHRFGQNFLHDPAAMRAILDAAAIRPGETILEVGPGTGTLTESLLAAGARVVACELDRDMAAIVRARLGDRITLVEADCLSDKHAVNPALLAALAGPFRMVANLPYAAATPLIANLLEQHPECGGMVVTIQREVADRLTARYAKEIDGARAFLLADDVPAAERPRVSRIRAALVFIESYRELPLLAWPRAVIDALVAFEQAFVIFRQRHARMVERVIGRRTGTGGSAGVDYLDQTALRYRIFRDVWAVRTLLVPERELPPVEPADFYGFAGESR